MESTQEIDEYPAHVKISIESDDVDTKVVGTEDLSPNLDQNEYISTFSSSSGAIIVPTDKAVPILVPFTNFIPIISNIGNTFIEIIELVEAAEHNKRICKILQNRVHAAYLAVLDLRIQRDDRKNFFNRKNYKCLHDFSDIITQIRKFILEISQMITLIKYIQAKTIEKTFKELCEEFDVYVNLLYFSINVKIADELEQLKSDQVDLVQYLEGMEVGTKKIDSDGTGVKACPTNLNKFSIVVRVSSMSNTMGKYENVQNQTKIENIFQVYPLDLDNYEKYDNESHNNRRVTKWYNKKNKGEEFAFKTISENEDHNIVQNQVTILKELHDWENIIKFYGLVSDKNKCFLRYLVTEWAEYGNLREFYTNHGVLFDLRLKLSVSLDIARGLNFLRAVEIVHRDIRAENILITFNKTAKLANFKLSRYLTAATLNQSHDLERIRYCAPEVLMRDSGYKYDQKCEVYSFGILLWEIAEEKIPYKVSNNVDIVDKVCNKRYREPFSENSPMPEEFKQLEIEAVHQDPDFRPKITKMFEVLKNCFRDFNEDSIKKYPLSQDSLDPSGEPSTPKSNPKQAYDISSNLPNFESFKFMSLTDATKQHKIEKNGKIVGDLKAAYKCFEEYANQGGTSTANRNQIKAKYFKALYISKGFVESPPNKDKIVADLYKEVSDAETNEFPEAKIRYGDCLYNGKGVEKNESEALKYFEKAAEDGFKVAMYNTGNMYFKGIGCVKNREKGIHYMKLAAYNDYEPAIKFCIKYKL